MKQLMRIHIERRNVRLPQESSFKRSGNFFPSLQATAIRTSRMILIFFALHKRLANRGIPSSAFPQACAMIFQAFGIGSPVQQPNIRIGDVPQLLILHAGHNCIVRFHHRLHDWLHAGDNRIHRLRRRLMAQLHLCPNHLSLIHI